jgi:glycosyltransferase involved in cell wall biosynthesis
MLIDIFMTTKDRGSLFKKSLQSFFDCTDRTVTPYRLTVVRDGDFADTRFVNDYDFVDHVLTHNKNLGLGPSINQALAHIDALNKYYGSSVHKGHSQMYEKSDFICYCQDDLLYSKGWLERMIKFFIIFEKNCKLGFASGVECIEHQEGLKDLGNGMLLKHYIRAAQMFGRTEYWMSMYPIPAFDPETRQLRAKPNDGIGSGVDWHFIRNHENSVCRTGRTCLVFPGLVKHMGYDQSTWLKREMPESESDKLEINASR